MIKGAIFDVDGTLLDSMPMWGFLCSDYIRKKGKTPEEGLDQKVTTYSFDEGIAFMKEQYEIDLDAEVIKSEILEMIRIFYEEEVQAKEGVPELLKSLKGRNIPMVIATSSDKELVAASMRRLGLSDYFLEIFTCDELHTSKREGKIYEAASGRLGTIPEETWVFEDAPYAVKTAAGCGYHVVAVYDAASALASEEIKAAAREYVNSLAEVKLP